MSQDDEKRRCFVCGRRELTTVELQTCTPCIGNLRVALSDIVDLYAALPAEITGRVGAAPPIGGVRGNEMPMPGGDALVMWAGVSGQWKSERTDVESVLALALWEDDWRLALNHKANRQRMTVTSATNYLLEHLAYAAQRHPAFDEFAQDVTNMRASLRRVLRANDPKDVTEIECPTCGGELKHEYADPNPCDHPGKPHCDHSHVDPKQWQCRGSNTCGCDQGGRRDAWVCRRRGCPGKLEPGEYWSKVRIREHEKRERKRLEQQEAVS